MSNHTTEVLGAFYLLWSHFELRLEIISHRIMGTPAKTSNIVLGTLGFQAKQNIAICLLTEYAPNNHERVINIIRQFTTTARRNHVTHSIVGSTAGFDEVAFFRREIANGFKVKVLETSGDEFRKTFDELMEILVELDDAANITTDEMNAYHLANRIALATT